MAGSAETVRQTFYETHDHLQEKFAESLGPVKLMGALACENETSVEYLEQKEMVFNDFAFAVAEMMATDPDFRECLDVNLPKQYKRIDGKVRAANGEPMAAIVKRGVDSSRKAAEEDPAMGFQVVRDESDEQNTESVDKLPIGWTRFVPSMDPKEAFKTVPKTAEKLGYEEGMMYWWSFSRTDETTMDTRARSVDMSDTNLWSEVIKDFLDADIPEDISADEWSRCGIEIKCGAEEAEQLLQEMASEYYRRSGNTKPKYSVTEFMQHNDAHVRQIFEAYYPDLIKAANSGQNNRTVQEFASHILNTSVVSRLESEARRRLIHIASSDTFTDEHGRVMNSILRYVTVEELRKGLPAFIRSKNNKAAYQPTAFVGQLLQHGLRQNGAELQAMHTRMAANFQSGVEARRSYGGCAGQIGFAADSSPESVANQALNPQDTYGRAANENKQESRIKTGKINCIKCHKPVDTKKATEEKGYLKCTHCKLKVEECTGKVVDEGILGNEEAEPPQKTFDLSRLFLLEESHAKIVEAVAAQAA